MKISEAFPSKYLKAADLNGTPVRVKIKSVALEDVGGQGNPEDTKPVISFTGTTRPLVCNRTNATTIAASYGDDTDQWLQKELEIYPDTVHFNGKVTPCLRVRTSLPAARTDFDDDNTFG